jgi:isocitrate/isopropylmalate dehydrogenase
MLEHLGETDAAGRLMGTIEAACREGIRTRDVGGDGEHARSGRRRRRTGRRRMIEAFPEA